MAESNNVSKMITKKTQTENIMKNTHAGILWYKILKAQKCFNAEE